jgi:hypothetical protein
MYTEAEIENLSLGQLRKLLKGGAVRVRCGSGMKVGLSMPQQKKLMSAHKKGKMTTLMLDPYQQDMMRGSGFFDNLGSSMKQAFTPPPPPAPIQHYFQSTLPSALIHEGIPIVTGTLGGIAGTAATGNPMGGMAGSFAGGQAGKLAADEIGRKTGYGMKKGRGFPSYKDLEKAAKKEWDIADDKVRKKGGRLLRDQMGDVWYDQVPQEYHAPIESMGQSTLKRMGFGMKKKGKGIFDQGSQALKNAVADRVQNIIDKSNQQIEDAKQMIKAEIKKKGGRMMRDQMSDVWYDQVPQEYHAPLESMGKSTLKRMGFGMKKGKGMFGDMAKSAAKQVAKKVGSHLVHKVLPAAAMAAGTAAGTYAGNPALGAMAGKMAGRLVEQQIAAQTGLGLKRGRPRKSGGALYVAGAR